MGAVGLYLVRSCVHAFQHYLAMLFSDYIFYHENQSCLQEM